MNISQRGLDLIARFEGFVPHAYEDPIGHCTVAFGHLIHHGACTPADFKVFGSKANPRFTREQGLALLKLDVQPRENAVDNLVSVPLTQNQFDALVSFVFNVGTRNFETSTMRRLLNNGQRQAAADEFGRWVHASGVVLPGLVVRRAAERAMFLDNPAPKDGGDVEELQRSLNRFTEKWLDGWPAKLVVDGVKGPGTNSRVMRVKWYLGYGDDRDAQVTSRFVRRMRHPRSPRYSTAGMIARGVERRRRFKRRMEKKAHAGDALWGGSRYFTNRAIEFVGARADVTSRKRVATFGNPGSDHHVSQLTADAVDFGIAEAHTLADELAAHLGGPSDIVDYQRFNVRNPQNGGLYRLQLIAGTHGTGPHLHLGARRV
jgi:lysozyme